MNTKPNIPGEIFLGNQDYSVRMDLKVSGWLVVATLLSCFSDIICPGLVSHWPLTWRVGLVLAQFAALLLWVRNLTAWIRGMDELHRHITQTAVLFAVGATFLFVMLWHRLEVAGLFEALLPGRKGWDICTVGHEFLLLTLFYFIGHTLFNRRYQ